MINISCAVKNIHVFSILIHYISFSYILKNSFKINQGCRFYLKNIIMANNRYCIDFAKRGVATCKNCNTKIDKGLLRIAKIVPNPFTDEGGEMKQWFHVRCIFEKLSRARATTKKIESTDDLEGWESIDEENRQEVLKCLSEFSMQTSKKAPQKQKRTPQKQNITTKQTSDNDEKAASTSSDKSPSSTKDDSFRVFRKICTNLSEVSSYKDKTSIIANFFSKGTDGNGFKGDLYLWVKLLLPGVNKRIYNLQNKQLIKLFSDIFGANHDEMKEDLEQGDVAETIRIFFEDSKICPPVKKSDLTLQEVDQYLDELAQVTRENDQSAILRNVVQRCTGNDLKMFIRFIKHDLRINAGPKHILGALHPDAYEAFQASQDLEAIVRRSIKDTGSDEDLVAKASLMTPIKPMLAQACRSIAEVFKKCPNGLLVEIKYDGERVQVHKNGNDFSYFSRSLKPVMQHKIMHLKEFIPKAFPHGNNLILDSEILLVDADGKPLPFGSLGAHKKNEFSNATVCLFIFDCLQFNNENLMNKPLIERRKILEENMQEIKKHIMFSELKPIKTQSELKDTIHSIIQQGLEGLLVKDKLSIYEPGKRHWIKIKKDYLKDEGQMADSADLVVLGAFYGTGIKGGKMSIFLMGCFDEKTKKWCTVTKVSGQDDETLERLQTELDMIKISKDPNKIPSWLNVTKTMIPDFIASDPKKSPVWEITGAEFSKAEIHTAKGISIRFPRVTRIRNDKTWKEATSLQELQELYETSKQKSDMIGFGLSKKDNEDSDQEMCSSTDTNKTSSPAKMPQKHRRSETKSPNQSNDDSKYQPPKKNISLSNSPIKTLPDVFTGIKLVIPTDLEKADELRRYFVAFDGELLDEHQESEANLKISRFKIAETIRSDLPIVTPIWLWDCIKLKKRLPYKLYKPSVPE